METEVKAHRHQDNQYEIVVGNRLQVGDVRSEVDVYESQNKVWAPVPPNEIGRPLGRVEAMLTTYVRPRTPRI